jgi:hypothetical protein
MHTGVKIRGNRTHFSAEEAGTMLEDVVLKRGQVDAGDDTSEFLIMDADGDCSIGYEEVTSDDGITFANSDLWRMVKSTRSFSSKGGSPFKVEGTNDLYYGFTGIAEPAKVTNSGDGTPEKYSTQWTITVGTPQLNLGNGVQTGQIKKIQLVTMSGTLGRLVPSNYSNPPEPTHNQMEFYNVGDFVVLAWDGNNWIPIEIGNDADGTGGPISVAGG